MCSGSCGPLDIMANEYSDYILVSIGKIFLNSNKWEELQPIKSRDLTGRKCTLILCTETEKKMSAPYQRTSWMRNDHKVLSPGGWIWVYQTTPKLVNSQVTIPVWYLDLGSILCFQIYSGLLYPTQGLMPFSDQPCHFQRSVLLSSPISC